MKTMAVFLFSIFLSNSAFAKELPAWVEKSAKLQSYEQLVEWMKNSKFYRITRLETKEAKIESGQTAQKTEISFDDDSGCKDRKLFSTCVPLGLDTDQPYMFCVYILTDCTGNTVLQAQKISK